MRAKLTKTNGHNGNGNGNGNGRWSAMQIQTLVLVVGLLVSGVTNYVMTAAKTGEDERRIVKLEEVIVPRSEHIVRQQQEDKILEQLSNSIIRIEDKLDHIGQQVTAQQSAQSYNNNSKR